MYSKAFLRRSVRSCRQKPPRVLTILTIRSSSLGVCLARLSAYPMLKETLAVLLVLLSISPFTVPFSTCDLATLAGNGIQQENPLLQTVSQPALVDGSVGNILVPSTFGRIKFLAWAACCTTQLGPTPHLWISAEAITPSNILSQSISPGILRI